MLVIALKNSKPSKNQHPSCNLTIHKFIWPIFQAMFGPVWVKAEFRDLSTDTAKSVERKESHFGWTLMFGYMITCWASTHYICFLQSTIEEQRESCCLPGPAAGHLLLLTAPGIPLPASCLAPFSWDGAGGLGCLFRKCC